MLIIKERLAGMHSKKKAGDKQLRKMVGATWIFLLVAWCPVRGAQCVVPGARYVVPGAWRLVPLARRTGRGASLHCVGEYLQIGGVDVRHRPIGQSAGAPTHQVEALQ